MLLSVVVVGAKEERIFWHDAEKKSKEPANVANNNNNLNTFTTITTTISSSNNDNCHLAETKGFFGASRFFVVLFLFFAHLACLNVLSLSRFSASITEQ